MWMKMLEMSYCIIEVSPQFYWVNWVLCAMVSYICCCCVPSVVIWLEKSEMLRMIGSS